MRETGPDLGGLSYQHLQRPRVFDDEAWVDHLVRVGSLRYRALKKPRMWKIAQTIRPDPLLIVEPCFELELSMLMQELSSTDCAAALRGGGGATAADSTEPQAI